MCIIVQSTKKLPKGMKWLKQATPLIAVGSHTQRAQNLPLVLQQVTKLDNFASAMMHLISVNIVDSLFQCTICVHRIPALLNNNR